MYLHSIKLDDMVATLYEASAKRYGEIMEILLEKGPDEEYKDRVSRSVANVWKGLDMRLWLGL